MADPREARFLASQAERLAGNNNKKQQHSTNNNCKINDSSPELVNEDNSNVTDAINSTSTKAQSNQFFTNFRKICSQYQGQIDTLLLVPSSTSDLANDCTSTTKSSNYTEAKAYYATSTKRNEGQLQLNSILNNVRTLQRHALSSSSSINTHTESTSAANENNDNDELLQSILQTPMTDITQTDIRLISCELDKIIKYIDVAREIICPKEKFIFKRYRKAMAEQKMLEGESGIMHSTSEAVANKSSAEKEEDEKQEQDNLRTKYGGVLEDVSNCTVEISASGTVLINETTQDDLQFYSEPRSVHSLHPASHTVEVDQKQQPNDESSSYLLQNLSNVTILIHGSRPSLHLQHIYNCKVYISQPTLGPVHVTDCISSSIHCSCYQLRIHESKDVRFKCWVRSGPIIEDCTGMVFEGDYYSNEDGNNLYWDVKDFNWLRTLRKSPNFVVIKPDTKESDEEKVEAVSEQKSEPEVCSVEAAKAEEEEDSEDEL